MINREDWLMIREMRAKGCYLKDIAREVGVSERMVRRALTRGGPPPRHKAGIRPSKLDPYKAQVDQLLREGVWNAEVMNRPGFPGDSHRVLIKIMSKLSQQPEKFA